jgi:hypothetical protein
MTKVKIQTSTSTKNSTVNAVGNLNRRLGSAVVSSCRVDVTAPITFVLAGLLLTHGSLAVRGAAPSNELIKELAEFTLALVGSPTADRAVAVIAITVLLRVVAHGATAEPLAARYAKLLAIAPPVALVP